MICKQEERKQRVGKGKPFLSCKSKMKLLKMGLKNHFVVAAWQSHHLKAQREEEDNSVAHTVGLSINVVFHLLFSTFSSFPFALSRRLVAFYALISMLLILFIKLFF